MSDRELLEMAAKAADVDVIQWDGKLIHNNRNPYAIKVWNPLTDDGDALRLAVKLRLRVCPDGQSRNPVVRCWRSHYESPDIYEAEGDNPYAATRRAIVRAAAEIGRSMSDE